MFFRYQYIVVNKLTSKNLIGTCQGSSALINTVAAACQRYGVLMRRRCYAVDHTERLEEMKANRPASAITKEIKNERIGNYYRVAERKTV